MSVVLAAEHLTKTFVSQGRENYTAVDDVSFSVKEGEILCKGAASVVNSWNNGNGPLFRLSLLQANLWVLKNCGIQEENIVLLDECTCCNPLFGSNRRETAGGTNFTVQLAFVRW